ncbi:hypothetical protein [Stutzerimonas kunmingensis]|uniref:hypothetical protein n=1 Tax=Stutzerimonas kunmingensis TaxID=1211807 RepID=UPI0028AA3BD8|nr:hypothetical protein [Stutzerimonas kunmingensis]
MTTSEAMMALFYVSIGVIVFLLLTAAIGTPIVKHLDRKLAGQKSQISIREKLHRKRQENGR